MEDSGPQLRLLPKMRDSVSRRAAAGVAPQLVIYRWKGKMLSLTLVTEPFVGHEREKAQLVKDRLVV